jgi:hypothetical protein
VQKSERQSKHSPRNSVPTPTMMTKAMSSKPPPAPALYRLHMNTLREDRQATMQLCQDGKFVGVGWGVGSEPVSRAQYANVTDDWIKLTV